MSTPSVRRDPRAKLTHAQVVAVARKMLEADGLDGFSMRQLAAQLHVAPMTVYGYFRDQDELFDAVLDQATAIELRSLDLAGSWTNQLRQLCLVVYEHLIAHPYIVQLRFRRPLMSPGVLRLTEIAIQLFARGGYTAEEAARAFRPLFIYTFGFAAFSSPPDVEAAQRHGRAALAGLSEDQYPGVSRASEALAETLGGRVTYEYGLNRILDGLVVNAPAKNRRKK